MNDITNSHALWHSEWKIFLCEFWLLRCSTMVARAWPVMLRWFRIGCLLPESNEPTLMFMTLLSWDIPLISFNGSLWDVLLRCSKWLLGAWLIASQWSWDADWSSESNEPAPLSLWHCDPEFMFNWKAVSSQWGNFGTLLPPRGASFTHCVVCSYRARQPLQMWQFHISTKSTLWARVCEFGC